MSFEYAIALTGGIATGKSTVASLLVLNGMRVIDADSISHKILEDSKEWVIKNFGQKYIKNSKVDRKTLGKLVFSNKEAKKILEKYLKKPKEMLHQ